MPLPFVAITVEDGRLSPEAEQSIVASCARASGEARCVEERSTLASTARYQASIRATTAGTLHVTLVRRGDKRSLGERDLLFATAEFGPEHYNSAGLVVAALVADAELPPNPREPAKPCPNPTTKVIAAERVWARLDVTGLASPGFPFDPWRFGGQARIAFGARDLVLYPVLATRWATANGQVESQAFSAAFGFGARLLEPNDRLGLALELSAVSDALLVSVPAASASAQRFDRRVGARVTLALNFRLVSALHVVAGVDVTCLNHRAAVEFNGNRLGTELRYVPGFTMGLGLHL